MSDTDIQKPFPLPTPADERPIRRIEDKPRTTPLDFANPDGMWWWSDKRIARFWNKEVRGEGKPQSGSIVLWGVHAVVDGRMRGKR